MDNYDDQVIFQKEKIENPLKTAFKTTFLAIGLLLILATILNVPLYLIAEYLPLSTIGFPTHGFMDVWPLSYLGANIFSVLALTTYVSGCGKPLACAWYLM